MPLDYICALCSVCKSHGSALHLSIQSLVSPLYLTFSFTFVSHYSTLRFDALRRLGTYPELQDHLKNHIDTLLEVLPADLQSTLRPSFKLV